MPGLLFILVDCKPQNFKNLSIQSESKTHTVLGIAEHFVVKIDPELVQRLGIRDGDIVSQYEDGTRTIRLIFKGMENTVAANCYRTNNQDYGE
jgi:anaerobic selenocysteine-containing dehydrogenase